MNYNIKNISGNIGLIDNDMINRDLHNFPNLALMKISSYLKSKGNNVELTSWDSIGGLFDYDYYVVSKVFSDTHTPDLINKENIIYGGSGFFYDKAEKLPYDCEHIMPDYDLYKNAESFFNHGKIGYYKDHSIGFMTRGCIRQCEFCINRNSKRVEPHSPLSEFYDETKPYITLLDDNITAYKNFNDVWKELQETKKPFVFKQGMDFRLLNEKRIKLMSETPQYGKTGKISQSTYYFAFDNIADKKRIDKVMQIWNANMKRSVATWMYCITGFDRTGKYENGFFEQDYNDLIWRMNYLYKNRIRPYVMVHDDCRNSPFYNKIKTLKMFSNSPINCTNRTFEEFLIWKNKKELYKYELNYNNADITSGQTVYTESDILEFLEQNKRLKPITMKLSYQITILADEMLKGDYAKEQIVSYLLKNVIPKVEQLEKTIEQLEWQLREFNKD